MDRARTPTERRRESPRRLLLLLGLAGVLGGLLVWDRWADWSGPAPQGGTSAPVVASTAKSKPALGEHGTEAGTAGAVPIPHALAGLALDELSETVRRPLFERTRRPVEAPRSAVPSARPAAAPKRQADPNALTLQGVMLNEGRSAIALMRRTQTGQSMRLQEGDAVDGWTVERIEADRVHLVHGETRVTLQLFRKR